MSAARRPLGIALVLAIVASSVALPACNVSFGNTVEETREYVRTHEPGTALRIEAENGSITVRQGGSTEVKISARIRATDEERLGDAAVLCDRLTDGTLTMRAVWPDKRKGSEGCSFTVEIPDVSTLHLVTSNGGVKVKGLTAPLEARTSNGRIEIEDHEGDVIAHTSNGRVAVETEGDVDAESSNGRIHVKMGGERNGALRAVTSNGRIKLELGDAWQGSINARTSNGRIKVDDDPNLRVERSGKRRARIIRGQGGDAKVETSNGTIEVRFRN